jgi:hypothetical protein
VHSSHPRPSFKDKGNGLNDQTWIDELEIDLFARTLFMAISTGMVTKSALLPVRFARRTAVMIRNLCIGKVGK